jgi:hypothetical protein
MGPVTNYSNYVKNINMAEEGGWTTTHHAPKDFLKRVTRTGKRIGSKSKFGTVSSLNYNGKSSHFVVKKISFAPINLAENKNKRHIFNTEVRVGSMNRIGAVGPRVLAYKKSPYHGEYIMNDVKMGQPNAHVYSLSNIRRRIKQRDREILFKHVQNKINQFHNVTHGEHGDLHGGNILVITRPNGTNVKIIDYGAFRTFKELKHKGAFFHKHLGMKAYNLGPGQKFISDKSWLNRISVKRRSAPV